MHKRLANDALHRFIQYSWPGNVRELENLIERLVVTTRHDIIGVSDLSAWSELISSKDDTGIKLIPLHEALENTEREILNKAFTLYNSTYAVARALGVSQPTIVRKTAKYGILRN